MKRKRKIANWMLDIILICFILGGCIVLFNMISNSNQNISVELDVKTLSDQESDMKNLQETPKDMEEEVQAFETETETEARWEVNGNSIIEVLLPDWKNKSKNTKEQSVSMCKIFIPVRGWK